MKVLALYPYLDPSINSIAQAILWLGANGNEVLVVAARTANSLKGDLSFDEESRFPGVTIVRPYTTSREQANKYSRHYARVLQRAREFSPELLFCSSLQNFSFARALQKDLQIPIVVNVEKLQQPLDALKFRGLSYLKKIGATPILSAVARLYMRLRVFPCIEAMLFSFYGDMEYSRQLNTKTLPVHYVPWCNNSPEFDDIKKTPAQGIYIGGINDTKNTSELVAAIPILLEKTSTKKFTVIGPGPYATQMQELVGRYPGRVEYITNLPLAKAQRYIAEAGYAFTPVINMGWGFVGDCWSLKTALVATHKMQGFINHDVDCLIADNLDELPVLVERLITDTNLRQRIEKTAYSRYTREQSAQAVGSRYADIFRESINSWENKGTAN